MHWSSQIIASVVSPILFITLALKGVASAVPTRMEEQLRTCRNAVVGMAGVPASIVDLSVRSTSLSYKTFVDIRVTKNWSLPGGGTTMGNIGNCTFDNLGRLILIDTLAYSAKSPSHFQDFGNTPLGRFIVILRSKSGPAVATELKMQGGSPGSLAHNLYYSTIGRDFDDQVSVFSVLVNDKQERWYAECQDKDIGYIGRLDDKESGLRELPATAPNTFTRAVGDLVCK